MTSYFWILPCNRNLSIVTRCSFSANVQLARLESAQRTISPLLTDLQLRLLKSSVFRFRLLHITHYLRFLSIAVLCWAGRVQRPCGSGRYIAKPPRSHLKVVKGKPRFFKTSKKDYLMKLKILNRACMRAKPLTQCLSRTEVIFHQSWKRQRSKGQALACITWALHRSYSAI